MELAWHRMIREMQYDMPRLPTSIASCKDRLICYIFSRMNKSCVVWEVGIFGCEMSPRLGWDEKRTSSPVKIQAHWDGVAGCRFYEGCLWAIPPWTWSTFIGKNYGCRGLKSDRILGNFLIDNIFLSLWVYVYVYAICDMMNMMNTMYDRLCVVSMRRHLSYLKLDLQWFGTLRVYIRYDLVNEIAAINWHCQT